MPQAGTSNKQARGWTQALERAAEAGDARLVGELLAAGAMADVRLEGGATPLMRAAARGCADVARALLDAGADVNARRGDGFTPLILAVFFGHEEVVRLLLERGADPSAATSLGVSARGWADARGFKIIGELLRQAPPSHARPATAPRPRVTVTLARSVVETAEHEVVSAGRDADGGVASRRAMEDAPERVERVSPRGPATAREGASYEPQFQTPERGFTWSWQASVGVVLVLAACGVGAFALWQQSRGAGVVQSPTPPSAAGATQAAQPLPTPAAPDATPQLTPTPFVDPLAGAPPPDMPGAFILQPDPSVQPVTIPPDAAGASSSSVPSVVSESGAEPTPEGPARREPRDPRNEAAAPDANAGSRDDARRPDQDTRAADAARRNPETQSPPPAAPQPAPSATPRRRVIQWPPQE